MNQLPPELQYKILDNFSILELNILDKVNNRFLKDYIKTRLLTCDTILQFAHPDVFKLVFKYFTNDDWYYYYKNYLHLESDLHLQLLSTGISESIINITYNTQYSQKIFFINHFTTFYENLVNHCTNRIALKKILHLLMFNAYIIPYYFPSIDVNFVEKYNTIWMENDTLIKRFQISDVKFCNNRLYFSVNYSQTNKNFISKSVHSIYGEYYYKNNKLAKLPDCLLTIDYLIEQCMQIDNQSDQLSDDESSSLLSDDV